jgi:hypothetical protein
MRFIAVSCNTKLSAFGLILSSALMLCFQLPVRANESVQLAWHPSSTPNVTTYKIYYGPASHSYSNVVAAGNCTNVTISGLVPGKTYYFAATTVNSAGNESGFSDEISNTVPVTAAALTSAVRSGGQFSFTVSGDAGQRYVVQASTDLLNWISIQTNAAPFLFTDKNAAGFDRRFYRVFHLAP